jgi:hypothetical protein
VNCSNHPSGVFQISWRAVPIPLNEVSKNAITRSFAPSSRESQALRKAS